MVISFVKYCNTYPYCNIYQHAEHASFAQNEDLIDYRIESKTKCDGTTDKSYTVRVCWADSTKKEQSGKVKQREFS